VGVDVQSKRRQQNNHEVRAGRHGRKEKMEHTKTWGKGLSHSFKVQTKTGGDGYWWGQESGKGTKAPLKIKFVKKKRKLKSKTLHPFATKNLGGFKRKRTEAISIKREESLLQRGLRGWISQ